MVSAPWHGMEQRMTGHGVPIKLGYLSERPRSACLQVDIEKEHPNVTKMRILGCKLVAVTRGGATLKEAVDSAFEEYLKDPDNFFYAIGRYEPASKPGKAARPGRQGSEAGRPVGS